MRRFDVGGPFVGRAQQLEQLDALVAGERLVSVVGPPGIGKSRLAGLVAERVAERWSGGAVACTLTTTTTAEQACAALAAALEVPLTSKSTLAAAWRRIGNALSARGRTLLLLDDLEQLAAHADTTVGVLLAAAPDTHVLATTRERLRLHPEVVYELGPLTEAESLALLLARARGSGARLDEASPALAAIVARLDGLPLALELAAARLRVMLEARAVMARAVGFQHAGRSSEAAALLERSRDVFVGFGAHWLAGFALGNLALLRQEQGRLDDADHAYLAALQALSDAGHERYRLLFSGFQGSLRWEQGRLEDAQAMLRAAAEGLEAIGDVRFGALFLAGAAAAAAALGFTADAAHDLARAQAALEENADSARLAAVGILEGVLEIARARDLRRTGNDAAAACLVAQARARLRELAFSATCERSDEVRLAARVLTRALGEAADLTEAPVPPLPTSSTLAVGAGACFFVTPAGSRADLGRHRAHRLLLARLVEQRVGRPGEPLSVEALIAAGWPGERILPRAAANRVYVAVTALRKLGLAGLLVRTRDGYLLDPAVEISTGDDEPPG